jgi:hypothetical protein
MDDNDHRLSLEDIVRLHDDLKLEGALKPTIQVDINREALLTFRGVESALGRIADALEGINTRYRGVA